MREKRKGKGKWEAGIGLNEGRIQLTFTTLTNPLPYTSTTAIFHTLLLHM